MRASETDRALICPASLALPRNRVTPEAARTAAAFGTLVHHWKATGEADPAWADPRDVRALEKKLVLSRIDREEWWPTSEGSHEVTFAVTLDPGLIDAVRSTDGNPDAWKRAFPSDGYLTGTADWISGPDVDDLKTGRFPPVASESGQLLSYALLPWIEAGMPSRWKSTVSITHWPKYPLPAPPTRTVYEVSAFQLRDHLGDLRHATSHPEEVNPSEEGCRYCPCAPDCPAGGYPVMNEAA